MEENAMTVYIFGKIDLQNCVIKKKKEKWATQ